MKKRKRGWSIWRDFFTWWIFQRQSFFSPHATGLLENQKKMLRTFTLLEEITLAICQLYRYFSSSFYTFWAPLLVEGKQFEKRIKKLNHKLPSQWCNASNSGSSQQSRCLEDRKTTAYVQEFMNGIFSLVPFRNHSSLNGAETVAMPGGQTQHYNRSGLIWLSSSPHQLGWAWVCFPFFIPRPM